MTVRLGPGGLLLVEVSADNQGLLLDGRPQPAAIVARQAAASLFTAWGSLCADARRAVVLVARGPITPAVRVFAAGLARATHAVVYCPAGPVLDGTGMLLCEDGFERIQSHADEGDGDIGFFVGPLLPEPGRLYAEPYSFAPVALHLPGEPPGSDLAPVLPILRAALTASLEVPAVVPQRSIPSLMPTRTDAASTGAVAAGSPLSLGRDAALDWEWVRAAAGREERELLRTLLGRRYEVHARAAASSLALRPSLRRSVTHDPLVSLIAVRAYLTDQAAVVDAVLRAAPTDASVQADDGGDVRAHRTLAACALAGAEMLPSLRGPVLVSVNYPASVVADLTPGRELSEPAFVRAGELGRSGGASVPVRYAVWTTSARRVRPILRDTEAPGVSYVLRPGTRFGVLRVEGRDGRDGVTVYLKELTAASGGDDELLQRLRTAVTDASAPVAISVDSPPIGVDIKGRAYAHSPIGSGQAVMPAPARSPA